MWLLLAGLLGAGVFSRLSDDPRGKMVRNSLALASIPLFTAVMAFVTEANGVASWVLVGHIGVSLTTTVILIMAHWAKHLAPDRAVSLSPRLGLTHGAIVGAVFLAFNPAFVTSAFALPLIITLGAQLLSPARPRTGQPALSQESAGPRPLPPTHQSATAAHPTRVEPSPAPALSSSSPVPSSTASWRHPQTSSRHSRLTALLLCGIIFPSGIAGLHRFYAGRWLSGLLWFFTFGLMGVGQFIDAILIATGHFRDAHGHPLGRWRIAPPAGPLPAERRHAWTPPIHGRINPVAMGLHLVGVLVLLLGLSLMLPVWFSLPKLVDTLPVFAKMSHGIDQALGYGGWPELIERLLSALGLTALITGTLLTAFARRGAIAHLLRALTGGGLLCFCAVFVATEPPGRAVWPKRVESSLRDLSSSDQLNPLANLDLILGEAMRAEFGFGLFWLAVAAALFVIPARVRATPSNHSEHSP